MEKYPYLPEGRSFIYVSEEDPFMQEAKDAWENLSNDSAHPTGAVVVLDNKIIGKAGNTTPLGWFKPYYLAHKKGFCFRKILKIPSGQKYYLCPGCANHTNHPERKTIAMAQKVSPDLSQADLYLYGHWWCCKPCWGAMIEAGIRNVYLLDKSEELWKRK